MRIERLARQFVVLVSASEAKGPGEKEKNLGSYLTGNLLSVKHQKSSKNHNSKKMSKQIGIYG